MTTGKAKLLVLRSGPALENGRLMNEMRMFVEAGLDASVFSWDRGATFPPTVEREGYTVRHCHARGTYGGKGLLLQIPVWWVHVFRELLRERPDYIHAVDFDTVVPALAYRLFRRVPVVFDVYDFFSAKSYGMPGPLKPIVSAAERFCARRSDGVIIVDEARRYLLGKRLPRRLVVAENCPYDMVDPAWCKPEGGPFTIFYAGLIARYRGISKLIRVTEGLEGVRVHIAGIMKDARYREAFEHAPHVTYLGPLDRDEVIRRTFEANAVYSYYDPALEINRTANSTKMFEAFMCGTPVLVNSEPPSSSVVAETESGACLPYDDEEALRATIIAWRDRPEEARRLGENGRRLFKERYDWARVLERILDLYRQLGAPV